MKGAQLFVPEKTLVLYVAGVEHSRTVYATIAEAMAAYDAWFKS